MLFQGRGRCIQFSESYSHLDIQQHSKKTQNSPFSSFYSSHSGSQQAVQCLLSTAAMFPLFEFSSKRNGRPLIFLITRIHLCKSLPASQSHLNDDLIFCYRVWHKLAGEREEFIGLELSLVRTNSAQRTVFFLHSVYLHKRSLTFIKDWTRCQTQSTDLSWTCLKSLYLLTPGPVPLSL